MLNKVYILTQLHETKYYSILKINDGLSKRRSYYLYFYTILLKMNLFRKINSGLFFYKKKFERCLEEKKPDLDIDSGVSKIR